MAAPARIPAFEIEEGSPHPLGATIQQNGGEFLVVFRERNRRRTAAF